MVTMAAPAAATKFAGTKAVTCVGLTKVVERGKPFQRRTELIAKFRPVTMTVKDAPPAVAESGNRTLMAGRGGSMVKERLFEMAPPGLATVTAAERAKLDRLAGTKAVTCEALTKVVERGTPFHNTVEPETKLIPLTVRVKVAMPSAAALGLRLVMVGAGG
jgi:hypothetical protein